jgi:putative hydrolase of the HAD superfamily
VLKAVFFDAAGTLFDARAPVGHTYARIAREHGVNADDGVVAAGFRSVFASTPGLAFGPGHPSDELRRMEREWWHRLVRKSFEGLGEFDDFEAFFDQLFRHFGDPGSWVALPETHAVLVRLKDTGLRLGVISNFDYRLYRILDGLDLRRFFDTVTISSEAGFAKPAREIFAAALSSVGVEASAAVHVGDSEHMDVRGAQAAGVSPILIDVGMRGSPLRSPIIDGGVPQVSSLAEVIKVMQLLGVT